MARVLVLRVAQRHQYGPQLSHKGGLSQRPTLGVQEERGHPRPPCGYVAQHRCNMAEREPRPAENNVGPTAFLICFRSLQPDAYHVGVGTVVNRHVPPCEVNLRIEFPQAEKTEKFSAAHRPQCQLVRVRRGAQSPLEEFGP